MTGHMCQLWTDHPKSDCLHLGSKERQSGCVKSHNKCLLFIVLTCPHVGRQAASCGHPSRYVWILVHYHYGCLPIDCRPLHHRVIFRTSQVEVQTCVVPCVISVTRQRHNANPIRVALGSVETWAVDNRVSIGCFHHLGEVLDSPHGIGAASFSKTDVVDVDATGGRRGVPSHCLESVAELHSDRQRNVRNFPCLVGISWGGKQTQ